ncbi:hypothetical protein EC970259_A0043 [Escherichia coli 99.0741]|nr:hypothetical protein EC970259_A0043 [Escherichia coli 99.0741]
MVICPPGRISAFRFVHNKPPYSPEYILNSSGEYGNTVLYSIVLFRPYHLY